MPNGNVLINWGSEGQITEYDDNGTILFQAFLDSGTLQDNVQNYRAFRFNWTGFSPETPALFAEEDPDAGETTVYISWNGDTETDSWSVHWLENRPTGHAYVAQDVKRDRFETVLRIPSEQESKPTQIHAEAIDNYGNVLAI